MRAVSKEVEERGGREEREEGALVPGETCIEYLELLCW